VKNFSNGPERLVADSLAGFAAAHPEVDVDPVGRVIYRAEPKPRGTVGLLSGGGSGHEPLHGGFVGFGMLDAAVIGEVFTSPTPDQILAATARVDTGAGVLHIVKNYTGDVMNFEMAAELGDRQTESVVVADDVAVEDSTFTAGRRGTGLTVLLEKIVGAAAEQGWDLAEVADLARRIAASGRSMGVALSSSTFDLPEADMEVGIGIHGEPGRRREPVGTASEIAAMLVDPILADREFGADAVIVMINGMGGTPLIELYVLFGEVTRVLEAAGVRIARSLVGNYITSLDMAGASVTVLAADDEMLGLWDAPVNTPALRWGI
jgi:dihydroxyacetone kinase-like protein